MKEKYKLWLVITSLFNYVIGKRFMPGDFTELPPIPDRCRMHDALYKQCCLIPPFFIRDVAQNCGAKFTITEKLNDANAMVVRRQAINQCQFWECILTAYDLFESPGYVDEKKYFAHLNRWVDLNKNFADVIKKAKAHCSMVFKLRLPLETCNFFVFQQCIRRFVNVYCPTQEVVPTKVCKDLKKFYDECNQFYLI